jgi:ribonuclease Z
MVGAGLRRLQLATSWGALRLVGGSRAGEGTLILLPQLHLALDPGRAHRALPPMRTAVVSHGHMDHIGALGYWASQRFLNSMPPATLIAPAPIEDDLCSLLADFARLEGGRPYRVTVVPVVDGAHHQLRRDMELEFFATDHWVPTLGTRIVWHKRRLRPELADLPGPEIARRRLSGDDVTEDVAIPILSYCADSGPGLLEARRDVLDSEIVLLECSFFKPADRDRATRYGHTHLEDLRPHLDTMRCRHLILLHASRRHRLREVEAILDEEIRPHFAGELHHLNHDWD